MSANTTSTKGSFSSTFLTSAGYHSPSSGHNRKISSPSSSLTSRVSSSRKTYFFFADAKLMRSAVSGDQGGSQCTILYLHRQ
jgi:hypothetical protein